MTPGATPSTTPSTTPVAITGHRLEIITGTPVLRCDWNDPARLDALARWLLALEPELMHLPRAPSWAGRPGNETSARYAGYNLMGMREPLAKQLFDVVKCAYRELLTRLGRPAESMYIQCWLNIARTGASMEPHAHPFPYHGHLTVQTDGSETIYGGAAGVRAPNHAGQVTILGKPGLVHEVPAYRGQRPRISVAFDLLPLAWVLSDPRWRRIWDERTFLPFD